ncbi:hypothetical protein M9980_03510 [Sphingomonas donggukensis]|uniref:DUF4139 domain-containing protein n=1 Tax=Sphingomonas donggukensis TaxID=2949093 RepID=A0ABY4TV95_9SPHN|nr:hypothetical protein [Sphingomonas donggukensis]URW76301.1 hypothetical protein M9980_03510 [Sphingomonas donggukensis]
MRRGLALAVVLATPQAAGAQDAPPPAIAASAPTNIAVTIYRNPYRRAGQAMDLQYLQGFALVTETRTVRLPAGVSTVRFEGVTEGIIPVSAVISGLPGGTIEKNRDARLLSPAALVDGTLGRHVTLRRTNRATGAVREEDAVIVAGPAQGVILRTAAGIEALRCSGLPETPVYAGIPAGLSAKPVLSVVTRSPRATTARVTLSYLTSDFDWAASYVADIAPDGRTLDLFAWMTLANGNAQTLANAEVSAVAGRLERRFVQTYRAATAPLSLQCFPLGTTTSDLPDESFESAEDIVVTGSRLRYEGAPPPPPPAMMAAPPPPPPPPEDLGDLKLYRVPMRVSVAANQQKQVALLRQSGVPYERVYRTQVAPSNFAARPVPIELRMRNEAARGLGIALPAGTSAIYQRRGGERLVVGLGTVGDTAAGQKFNLGAGTSSQVMVSQAADANARATVTLTNANASPVKVEVRVGQAGATNLKDFSSAVERVDGVWTWMATVPANGEVTLAYSYS